MTPQDRPESAQNPGPPTPVGPPKGAALTGMRHFTASAIAFDDQDWVLLLHNNKVGLWLYLRAFTRWSGNGRPHFPGVGVCGPP